ncbi:tRNA (adenosine(37)-N6)-threonylcarbamoyltransferase complex ATPase subunit type 1 TsaE [Mechercharimyces sp. CAU 1602]|uniref:tRNA (adenosine(37)-N6)-threonylcarbamoyltransferase complex ATPase subunit type 1 TsaE n=1 Tax=Mechercharimyces sp. CAU 1602 TaxID=2973933 RepID=UPI002161A1E7|nr:tRNA (adenosine(37)-N6)-threonylcarbamoyltransferase complex ATPase subunit type 1 TsaE [Mechercharimyces sp. CAU 1602]MCS1352126.1 tRNA (adenosine(37)-N6)-threonylcarbamoyltransferase complex ATPase subunit type 1 TsaE [Mechercharimyces sp. CAU 1602]
MNANCVWETHSAEETKALGRKLAQHMQVGEVVALVGNLGVGKTTFTQGFAEELGISDPVDSPTFTLIKEYEAPIPLYHMDVYRIQNPEEELGLEEYFAGDGITLVEWAQHIEPQLPEDCWWVTITLLAEGTRQICLSSTHPRVGKLCEELGAK